MTAVRAAFFAIKPVVRDHQAPRGEFPAQKTMYGGKRVAAGDQVFVFARENEGGPGVVALGVVAAAEALARTPGLARQTPRVSLVVSAVAHTARPLGRDALKRFKDWSDGRPETELNFKLYRQATNKVVGLTDAAAGFLRGFFPDP